MEKMSSDIAERRSVVRKAVARTNNGSSNSQYEFLHFLFIYFFGVVRLLCEHF